MVKQEFRPYIDLVHASRAVGLSLARVRDQRAWPSDADSIRSVAQILNQLGDAKNPASWDFDTSGVRAFASPEGFYLMAEPSLQVPQLGDALSKLSQAIESHNYSTDITLLAASLSDAFFKLAERTVEKLTAITDQHQSVV